MNLKRILWLLVVAVSYTFAAPLAAEPEESSVNQLKQESRELGKELQEFSADQKDQAEDSINQMLSALDKRIVELEAELAENWEDMSDTARDRSQESLESLREQRARVQTWYNELKASSASAWERAKKGFSEAYESFSEQWNEAEQDLTLDQEKRSDSI